MGSLRETNPSLWVGTTAESRFPTLSGDVEADVAVIGGGIAGLMTAALCRQDGHRVALLEAGRLAAGATGYTTAKLTALHGLVYDQLARSFGDSAAAQYADANLAGMAKVAALVDRHGIDCDFERQPAFTYTTDAGTVDKVQAEVATAERIGLGATFTTETGLPYPVAGAVRLDDQAQFHPRRYCLALADTIPGEGSHVFELSQAVEVHDADPCVVETGGGRVTAGYVVVATHLPFLDRGGFFARTHPMRSYALSATLDGPVPGGMYLSVDTPTRPVRPARMDGHEFVILRRSASELLKENANVVKRYVGDRLRTDLRRAPDDLAPGEAGVLRKGAGRVAAYRDPDGKLHVVSAACTHMGCTVTWNTAETTWDCPCHGSRFTADGEVLEGPALRPLERKAP